MREDFYVIKEQIKVAIADDNREFSELMHEYLNKQPDLEVVGVAYNGEQMITIIDEKEPDIIILDH